MDNRKRIAWLVGIVTVCCALMALVDGVWRPGYLVKSAVKAVLFAGCPIVYSLLDREIRVRELFRFDKKSVAMALGLGAAVYLVIVGGYFLFGSFFDFSAVADSLMKNAGVSRGNFIWISLYISFVNSLFEEFFFRGLAFLSLRRVASVGFAHGFGAVAFALYHVAMIVGWFSTGTFLLVMAGLAVGALLFQWLDQKTGTLYPSWMAHMCANFAINTIGFILLGVFS